MLVTKSEISYLPAKDVKIIDTVGAGDAFTASAVISFANGINLNQIHHKAVEIASFVCSKMVECQITIELIDTINLN